MSFASIFISDQPPGRADLRDFGIAVLFGAAAGALAAAANAIGSLHLDPVYATLAVGALKNLAAHFTGPAR